VKSRYIKILKLELPNSNKNYESITAKKWLGEWHNWLKLGKVAA